MYWDKELYIKASKVAEVINNTKVDGCFLCEKITNKIFEGLGL